jgi:hypothetical protein
MLYNLEPSPDLLDVWITGVDIDSEFVNVLNSQAFHFVASKVCFIIGNNTRN